MGSSCDEQCLYLDHGSNNITGTLLQSESSIVLEEYDIVAKLFSNTFSILSFVNSRFGNNFSRSFMQFLIEGWGLIKKLNFFFQKLIEIFSNY